MSTLLNRMIQAARRFTVVDFTIFKLCLLAFGILLGAYLSAFFLTNIGLVWILAFVFWIYMILRLLALMRPNSKN